MRKTSGCGFLLLPGLLVLASATPGSDWRALPQTESADTAATVTVEFRAFAANGQSVLDLNTEELTLKVDGSVREIGSLTLVQAGRRAAGEEGAGLAAPFASNTASAGGRDTVVVIDNESFPPGREEPVRRAVTQLLAGMSAPDRVGLITVPLGGELVRPTSQLGTVRRAIAGLVGQAPRTQSDGDALCRSRVNLEALRGLFASLSGEPLTTVIFFSTGLMPPTSSMHRPGTQLGLCEVRSQDLQDVARAMDAAAVSFYVVRVLEDVALGSSRANNLLAGLESLAAVTGGTLLRPAGDDDDAVSRILRETSAVYQLAFEPQATERNGARHRIELRIARQGVAARIQPTVQIPKGESQGGRAKDPPAADMLRAARIYRNLPLLMTGYSSQYLRDDKVKVVVVFEPVDRSVKLTSAVIGLFDGKGRLASQGTLGRNELSRVPIVTALVAPAGSYRLRVAATDASGRGGTVEEELLVGLIQAGPMKLSSIGLGDSRDTGFAPRLQFGDDPVVSGYLEIYGAPAGGRVGARFELARSEDAPAVASVQAAILLAPSENIRVASAKLPIGTLPAGDYLVRVLVSLDGQPAGRVARTLRKAAR